MTNFEGRKTDRDNKQDFISLRDDDFVEMVPRPSTSPCSTEPREGDVVHRVPASGLPGIDNGRHESPSVDEIRTAWFELEDAHFTGNLPGETDFQSTTAGQMTSRRMVRLVGDAKGCGDGVVTDTENVMTATSGQRRLLTGVRSGDRLGVR